MIRTLGGVAAGIAIAIVVMMIVEVIGNQLYPPPRVDLNNPNAPAALPLPNQLFPLAGWFLASLFGGGLRSSCPAASGPAGWSPAPSLQASCSTISSAATRSG